MNGMRGYYSRCQHCLESLYLKLTQLGCIRDTPPYSSNMAERGKKRYTAGEVLEAIFDDEDSLDEQFDCGSDVEMVPDSAESDSGSDLDAQITQIISNLEIGETNREHDNTTSFEAVNAPGM